MRVSVLFGILMAFLVGLPASASAVQVVLADTTVNHTVAGGGYESVGAGSAPADFTAPNDYAQGMLHHRVMVTTAPTNDATYKVCFVQGAQTACSANGIAINGVGTFEATQAITAFTNYGNLVWDMPMDDIQVVAMDTAGVAVDSTETTWIGSPDLALYYPLNLTYQAVVVAAGDAFAGYPGMAGNPAEAPALSPNGGTFEGSISVTLASGTMDAMIYYTTDGSAPDDTSTLYDGNAISITQTSTLRAITYATGFDPSPVTSADFTIVAQLSNGLRGRYYDSDDFQGLTATRTDAVIDFEFADGQPPVPDIGGSYSIIWTGQVTPRYTDTYTFKTVNDDGARLWVNDQLVIDDWNYHGPQERTGTISLTANQPVSIWLEYFNGGGGGTISLAWESPQQPDEIIPDTALVPNLPAGTQAIVSLFGGEIEARETDADPIVLPVRRRGAIDAAINVRVALTGTATSGEDFTIEGGGATVAIAAGALEGTLSITLTNDMLVEEDETITITLEPDAAYQVGSPGTATITILDDDFDVDSISGTITYTGTESGRIIVEAFRETDPVFLKRRAVLLNPGAYTIAELEEGDYTVVAYIDSNDNESLDQDEIWGIYQGADLQPALVTIPPGQVSIDINLDVAPGEPAGGDDKDGCCATIARPEGSTAAWLALILGAVVVGLRRRRR